MDSYTLADSVTILECGHAPSVHSDFTTGYGITTDGARHCYACCADNDRAQMIETGRATLYLTIARDTNPETGQTITRGWRVQNWPGSLQFPALYVRSGRHNIARTRRDFEFVGPDGARWVGVQYGENSEIAHCRRVKS